MGQNLELIKSIKKKSITASGKELFDLLSDLTWEYRTSYPDSAIYFGTKAYTLGQQLNLKTSLARPLNFIGIAYSYRGNNLNSFEYYNQAVQIATSQHDTLQLAHALNNLGRLFSEQGLEAKSIDYFNESLALFKKIGNRSGLAYAFQGIAGLYKIQNNFSQAEQNYKEAYSIRLALKNNRETMSALIQLGKLYLDNKFNDKALHYFQLADSTGRIIKDAIIQAEVKILLAECHLNTGALNEAEIMSSDGLELVKKSQNLRLLPEAYITMGRVQFEKNDLNNAKSYFTKALDASTIRKDLYSRMEAYFFLWQTFKQQHNYKDELLSYNQYLMLKDSVKSLEHKGKEDRFKFQMEIERRKQENDLLKAQEVQNIAIILGLVTITFITLLLLFALWKNRKRIKRFNDNLAQRNDEIKKINSILDRKNHILEEHVSTLLSFSKNRSIIAGNLAHAAKDIVTVTSKSLNVSRVSIWLYKSDVQSIESIACYDQATNAYLPAMCLKSSDCPTYFRSIQREKLIVAHDAQSHESTKDLTTTYLEPNNIYSLLDAMFFLDGELKGLLCCEQQDITRNWSAEDIIFASSVADIISLAFRAAQRLEHEHHIKQQSKEITQMNEVLEKRVEERTKELEKQNKQLVEYAFINSHLLRGPLSRILGLINLIEHDKHLNQENVIDLLRQSGDELDTVIKKISDTLHNGEHLNRNDLNK
ncbi:MAG TPA: tetratricopeptide repeat protein [Cyclobacteriaceae bacterium]